MKKRSEFIDFIAEQLSALGPIEAKAMFGGWGLYLDQLIFAIVADDELYVKSDAGTRDFFMGAGSTPFQYARGDGGVSTMNFYHVPVDVLEDPDSLVVWTRQALEAALRARQKKTATRR